MTENGRYVELMQQANAVFVFGSNLGGYHGAGAAKKAYDSYGAEWGRGEGISGRSYAIPTKDAKIETLPIDEIKKSVERFIEYASANPEKRFVLTRVGCVLAGYTDAEIAPLFRDAPENVIQPDWLSHLREREERK